MYKYIVLFFCSSNLRLWKTSKSTHCSRQMKAGAVAVFSLRRALSALMKWIVPEYWVIWQMTTVTVPIKFSYNKSEGQNNNKPFRKKHTLDYRDEYDASPKYIFWKKSPKCICSLWLSCVLSADHRRVRRDDNPLPPEEENWLLCDPDISALHHDSHPVPSVFLAQQRIRPCQDCLWWVVCSAHF